METLFLQDENSNVWNGHTIVRLIGKGSFGEIYEAKYKNTERKVSIKKISLHDNTCADNVNKERESQAISEAGRLKQMDHKHILKVVGEEDCVFKISLLKETSICIVTEYCQNGDLFQEITKYKEDKKQIPRQKVINWLIQLASAMAYLHNEKVVHRDITPKNIFLNENNDVILGDFGLLGSVTNLKLSHKNGTLQYLAPEVISNTKVTSSQSDYWSFGCVMYELLHLRPAIPCQGLFQMLNAIKEGKNSPCEEQNKEYETIYNSIMKTEPEKRMRSLEIEVELKELKKKILLHDENFSEYLENRAQFELRLIDKSAFTGEKMNYLDLARNKLTFNEDFQAFNGLTDLVELKLNDNQIETLNESLFSSLKNLKILWLQNNKILKITNKVFSPLVNLQTLYLSGNQISEIESGAFDALGKLNNLCLSGEKLASIPSDLFKNLSNLKKLHLKAYKGKLIPGTFNNLKELTELDLSDSALDSLEVVKPLSKLAKLYLTKNSLEILNLDFLECLVCLNQLNLSHNMIKSINSDLPAKELASRLDTIDLSGNKLTIITKSCWARMPKLVVVKLDKNEIAGIEKDAFEGLGSLEELSLTENNFSVSENEATLVKIPNDTVLKLSGNRDLEKINNELFDSKNIKIEAIYSPLKN